MRGPMKVRWLLPTVLSAALAMPASAQDVTYTKKLSISFGGAMDKVVGIAARLGGGSTDVTETQYLQGRRMRTDVDGSSTILDLEGGRLVSLDHKAKTYTDVSLDSMAVFAQAMATSLEQGAVSGSGRTQEPGEPEVDYAFAVSVEPTGEKQTVAGYAAERVFVTVELEARGVPEGEQEEEGGRMVLLTEMWLSSSVPGLDAFRALQEEQAAKWSGAAFGAQSGTPAMLGGDPRQRAALERAAEEMKKVEGMPVRTTTYMVMVQLDKPFDRDAALGDKEEEKGGVSAGQAAKSIVGGLLGRRRQQQAPPPEEQEPEEAPAQATLFKMVEELVEVSTSPLSASLFQVPQGYTVIGLEGLGGGAR